MKTYRCLLLGRWLTLAWLAGIATAQPASPPMTRIQEQEWGQTREGTAVKLYTP